jgi:type IV pilus assembly protein PilN
MIKINLLPFRAARKKENVRRQISIFLLTLILVVGCMVFFHMRLSSRIDALKDSVAKTEKEVKKYEKISKEIAEIKRKLQLLKKKMAVIRNLEKNRKAPAKLLEAMTQAIVPERMWFKSFSNRGNKITISGTAIDNKTVADFMTRLENMKENKRNMYRNVVVKMVKKLDAKKGRGADLKDFVVEFTKAPSTPPKKNKAKKK